MENVFDLVAGLEPVDPAALVDFQKTMEEEVIPEIVRVMNLRAELAARSWSAETSFVHNGKTYAHSPGCGWHVFLKLKDYDQGEFTPEES